MATEQVLMCDNKLAGADLSTAQYKIVKLSGANAVLASTAGELAYGVLQNAPVAGDAAGIAIGGRTKIQLGATLAPGTKFSTHQVLGTIVEGGASGEIGSALLDLNGVLA